MTTEKLSDDERECLLAVAGIPDGDGVAEKALRIIDALTEALAAAEEARSDEWDARVAAEARVRELDVLNKQNADVEARVIAVFQARLAAATALLAHVPRLPLDLAVDGEYLGEVRAFLANQPATPTEEESAAVRANAEYVSNSPLSALLHNQPAAPARCRDCGGAMVVIPDGFGEAFSCPRCDQPAAPTRCDQAPCLGSPGPGCCPPAAPTRTEAEQAVLDACIKAMAALSDDELRDESLPPTEAFVILSRAELARRGLK